MHVGVNIQKLVLVGVSIPPHTTQNLQKHFRRVKWCIPGMAAALCKCILAHCIYSFE